MQAAIRNTAAVTNNTAAKLARRVITNNNKLKTMGFEELAAIHLVKAVTEAAVKNQDLHLEAQVTNAAEIDIPTERELILQALQSHYNKRN
jgi:N-acetylglucosamine kinase-like BadF-type ATPase